MDAKEWHAAHFEQQRPADFTLLVYPPSDRQKFSGQLIYQHPTTGERVNMPNIWYNQPLEWQVRYADFLAEQQESLALKALRDGFKQDAKHHAELAKQHRQAAVNLRAQSCPIVDISASE